LPNVTRIVAVRVSLFAVAVGYKYSSCKHIFWETQSATMSGYDITSSEIGGWNLHIHHTYNFEEGTARHIFNDIWPAVT